MWKTLRELLADFAVDKAMISMLSMAFLMIFLMIMAYWLQKNEIRILHETSAGLLLGMALGWILSLFLPQHQMGELFGFNEEIFFVVLLPPIIFQSGFGLQTRMFFANITAISVYAFLGTMVSFSGTAVLMIIAGKFGLHEWSALECFIFGAVICASDTVGTIAIMEKSPVSRDLFMTVMGESVFNDAVAIVLATTCEGFMHQPVNGKTLFDACVYFTAVFFGSTLIGILYGLLAAMLLKKMDLRQHPHFEFILMLLFAYGSYFTCAAITFSGVCAILFCGVTMAHYCLPNISEEARVLSHHTFHPMSYICEMFVFVWLGLTVFAYKQDYNIQMTAISFFAMFGARLVHVFGLGAIMNAMRVPEKRLKNNEMLFLSFAAPRGAMSYALAMEVNTEHRDVILTVIIVICVITILLIGGTTYNVLELLGLLNSAKTGDDAAAAAPAPAENEDQNEATLRLMKLALDAGLKVEGSAELGVRVPSSSGSNLEQRLQSGFDSLDKKFLKRAFIRQEALEEESSDDLPLLPSHSHAQLYALSSSLGIALPDLNEAVTRSLLMEQVDQLAAAEVTRRTNSTGSLHRTSSAASAHGRSDGSAGLHRTSSTAGAGTGAAVTKRTASSEQVGQRARAATLGAGVGRDFLSPDHAPQH